jgi:transposase InsO family protein
VEIRAIHAEFHARYGSPRVHAELAARGHDCCLNTVAKLMRAHGIQAKTARRFRCTADSHHDLPVAENLLDRQFDPESPNESWVADITYIPTREGWLYLAAVEDPYSRRVVGWSMADHLGSRLVVDTLAVERRLPGEGLLAHSDRGSQYASDHYQSLLARHGITCSMSRRADCWDSAPMESFFASLKTNPTRTIPRRTRCRSGYHRGSGCLPVGPARAGPLLPAVPHTRRVSTMSQRPTTAPPRA